MKKITLAKNAGFCFGVRRAIQLAQETAINHTNAYILGDIVHNPHVVSEIKQSGIKKIAKLSKNNPGILIIRAHGAPERVYAQAKKNRYTIIDATCPMVKEIQFIAKKYESQGHTVIIIGDKKHAEVIGIKGHLKNRPLVIDGKGRIPAKKLKKVKTAVVVVQSTQNLENVKRIIKIIKKIVKDLIFFNTICQPTRQKQKEIRKLTRSQDVMIVIGAKSSANTKRLYEISKAINPHTYWVNSKKAIKKSWFTKKNKVGITAGASTPDYIIDEIKSFIQSL